MSSYADRADPSCEVCHGAGFTIHRPSSPPFWETMMPCRCLKPIRMDPVQQGLAYIRSRYGQPASGWRAWRAPARTPQEIDDRVDAWHAGAGRGMDLHEYLGWTWEEYGEWVSTLRSPSPDPPEHWKILGILLAIIAIALLIIILDMGGGA